MMSLSNLQFIFRFLPALILIYYLSPSSIRKYVLLLASLIFYALGDVRYLALLVAAVLINYFLGKKVVDGLKNYLVYVIAFDVALLALFKALGTFIGNSLIPVGISFYTFKMISYQIDLYKGNFKKLPDFVDTAVYFTLFAQIASGPIMRWSSYEENSSYISRKYRLLHGSFHSRLYLIEVGLYYFCIGLILKVMIADHLAYAWQSIGTIGYAHLSTPLAWLGVVIYSLNLYYDFWGYSLMASGIASMLGFPFIENFHHPYAASSVSDFYRRWHMSLGSWFRDYVYIPLGGSRNGVLRNILSLFAVWLLTGLWHGFSITFIIWAFFLLLLILCEKFIWSRFPSIYKFVGRFHVLVLVPLSWIPFAMGKWSYLYGYLNRLFPFANIPANVFANDYVGILQTYWPYIIVGFIGLVPIVFAAIKKFRNNIFVILFVLVLFWISIYSLSVRQENPFMYFKF